jgi:hypothetical protein
MAKLISSFAAAAMLATSVAATELDSTIPDGTTYQSDNPQSQQMHDRVNKLPEDATHIYVPEQQYHDKLGEREWITENQFERAATYLQYLGLYEGEIEYSHAAVPAFERVMDKFIDSFVVTDAQPDDYKKDLYAKYDMLRVHALENENFVEQVLQQGEEYKSLPKKTDFVGDIKVLDGYLGLMGQDYNVGTSNDGLRIQAIQEFSEGRTALGFLQQEQWDKSQVLSNGQTELMDGGLALLGYGANSKDAPEAALAAFYKDQNIAIDPPAYNLESLSLLHAHITKDGAAFDRVEEVLYDFDTVEEKVGYAQAALTFYGEHTELDDKRWAHTMLNMAQLSRRMGDALEIVKEEEPRRIFSDSSHVLWDSVRWANYDPGAAHTLPDINKVLEQTSLNGVAYEDQEAYLGGEDMRWSTLSDTQKDQFESSYIAIPLADFEQFLPEGADELKKTAEGRNQIIDHLLDFDTQGKAHFASPEIRQKYNEIESFFKEDIRGRAGAQHYTEEQLSAEAHETAKIAMKQVLGYLKDENRAEYSEDETSTLYFYMEDRAGGKNALKDSGNVYARTEHYNSVVHCINERNYLNYRAAGGDPNAPIPFTEAENDAKLTDLAQSVENIVEQKGAVLIGPDSAKTAGSVQEKTTQNTLSSLSN